MGRIKVFWREKWDNAMYTVGLT